jgi:hypothetical protein
MAPLETINTSLDPELRACTTCCASVGIKCVSDFKTREPSFTTMRRTLSSSVRTPRLLAALSQDELPKETG